MSGATPSIERIGAIGAGATGRVWHGRLVEPLDEWPAGTEVAVKELREDLRSDPDARRAFEVEAEVGARVRDPGLVRVLHAGEGPEGPRLVMRFVPGETLRTWLDERGPLPEPLLRSVAAQVAGGLAALHAAGFLHGDVKPDNMRLDEDGRAVLMDLGFARPGDQAGALRAGSLAYLSPEGARGLDGGERSDVFALGIVIYELATGRHPFLEAPGTDGAFSSGNPAATSLAAAGGDALIAAIAEARFIPPSRIYPRLSPFLDRLLREMLARDPARRPSSEEVYRRLTEQEAGDWWREGLEDAQPARTVPAATGSHLLPMVGRDRELTRLSERWEQVISTGRGAAVWLRGPTGSGKSRLMSDFAAAARARPDPPIYLYGRSRALEAQRPCGPILALLQRWLELPLGAEPTEREREHLARLVPPGVASTLAQALTPDFAGETFETVPGALAEWLVALASAGPLVVFVDDLNFADEGTLTVLQRVADELGNARCLLVLGFRDDEPSSRPRATARLEQHLKERSLAEEIALGPLDEAAVEALVEELFDRSAPRRRIAQRLWSRSRGNPGLIAEVLRGLIERGQAQPVSTRRRELVLGIPPEEIPMPSSLTTVINERFRRLSPLERAWLRRLSVVGGRIAPDFLAHAFPRADGRELGRMLTALVQAGWLVPVGDRYRFARPALREAVYLSASEEDRRAIHVAAARALSPQRGKRIRVADAYQRAFHLHAAGDHAGLLRVLWPLIESLLKRGQPQRVYTLACWGLEALEAVSSTLQRNRLRLSFLEAAADAADRLGRREMQRRWLDQLSDAELSPESDPETLARVYLLHGRYAVSTGQYGLARGMLRNAVVLAEDEGGILLSEALRRLSAVQAHVGELVEARQLARRARAAAAHDPQLAVAWLATGMIELLDDEIEPALRAVDRALSLLRHVRDWNLPGIAAAGHMLRGRAYRIAGRPRRALASMHRAVRMAQRAGERRLEAEATARLGGLLLDVNRVDEAEARLREAQLLARDIEDRRGQVLAGLWLGILLWEQEHPDAVHELERTVRRSREIGLGRVEALALAIRARVRREAGRVKAALDDTDRAREQVEQRGAELGDRIVILGTRALLLRDSGRSDESQRIVTDLRRRLRRVNGRIANDVTRRRHRVASTRLLDAVISSEGVIYPRVQLVDASGGPLEA